MKGEVKLLGLMLLALAAGIFAGLTVPSRLAGLVVQLCLVLLILFLPVGRHEGGGR